MSVEIRLHQPQEFNIEQWHNLQDLQFDAYARTTLSQRDPEEIDYLVMKNDFPRFLESHLDPNKEVGNRFREDQRYSSPLVAVAIDAGRNNMPVGWAYSAHNVSGSHQIFKRLSIVRNYHWLREAVVKPEYQQQGIYKRLCNGLLARGFDHQRVATYVWPEEIPFLKEKLENYGFVPKGKPTPERPIDLFGTGEMITQVRMEAPSAREVRAKLKQ